MRIPLRRVVLWVLAGWLSTAGSSAAGADQGAHTLESAQQNDIRKSATQPTPTTLPDYMQNWEFGVHAEEDSGFRYFADLIFPLYRPTEGDKTLFFEPRVSHVNHGTLLNFGTGYRTLVRNNTWLLGTNAFYDYETVHQHYRVGAGAEIISAYAELRANGYLGLSHTRRVQSDGATNNVERAVHGYDVELGGPVPYYSRLKLFGGYEWYNFRKFKDREGWTIRAEYKPMQTMVLDLTYSDNTKRTPGFGVNIAFRPPIWLNAPERVISPFRLDETIFPNSDVSDRLFTLVERHHEIVVESYSQTTGGISVEIRRGT